MIKRKQGGLVLFLVLASIAVLLAVWPLITDWMGRRAAASMPHNRMVVPSNNVPPPKVVRVEVSNLGPYDYGLPAERMGYAVQDNPVASQIRMTWTDLNPEGGDSATAVYDRHKHSFALYCESHTVDGKTINEDFLYTRVTDAKLLKLAKDHFQDGNCALESFFDTLPQYGCKRHKITAAQAKIQIQRLSF